MEDQLSGNIVQQSGSFGCLSVPFLQRLGSSGQLGVKPPASIQGLNWFFPSFSYHLKEVGFASQKDSKRNPLKCCSSIGLSNSGQWSEMDEEAGVS